MIFVDTREQLPLWKESKHIKNKKLEVGDYTIPELLNKVHAERKSPQDLCNSITKDHTRFRNEFLRAKEKNIKLAVFVECTEKEFYSFSWKPARLQLKTSPITLKKIIITMSKKYEFDVYWCAGRKNMRETILKWLIYHKNKLEEQKK